MSSFFVHRVCVMLTFSLLTVCLCIVLAKKSAFKMLLFPKKEHFLHLSELSPPIIKYQNLFEILCEISYLALRHQVLRKHQCYKSYNFNFYLSSYSLIHSIKIFKIYFYKRTLFMKFYLLTASVYYLTSLYLIPRIFYI